MADVDLGPAELDLLEDALEDLEREGALERLLDDTASPVVRQRLEDYRSILVASREALPLEDVRAGVLDDVLAQASRAAAIAPAAAAAGGTWWSRLRRSFMVPALALAGTAVLVLWVFDPADQARLTEPPPPAAPTAAASAPAASAPAASDKAAEPEEPLEQEAAAARAVEGTPTDQPALPVEAQANEDADDEEREAKRAEEAKPKAAGGGMGSLGDVPGAALGGAEDLPQKQAGSSAGPASGRWDIVARADRARQSGDCVAARAEYSLALEDDDPRVRARAFAGLGLCDAQDGDDAGSEANFERARELDGEVSSFIDSQQSRTRPAQKRKARPSKSSKAKKSIMLDDMNDPFSP